VDIASFCSCYIVLLPLLSVLNGNKPTVAEHAQKATQLHQEWLLNILKMFSALAELMLVLVTQSQ